MYAAFEVLVRDELCIRCKGALSEGSAVITSWVIMSAGSDGQCFYHPRCAVDVDARSTLDALQAFRKRIDDHDAVKALALARVKGIEALAQARSSAKKKGAVAKIPEVEPARDPQGRPRVRLYWAGNLASSSGSSAEPMYRALPDLTLRSPLREYVLLTFVKVTKKPLDNDPSQPLIGALFGTNAHVKLVGVQREKLVAWRAEGVRTPALWVHDPARDSALVDARVLEFRKALDEIGYAGDEATVVVTHEWDAESMALVARTLDEAFVSAERKAATADPGLRAAERLRELLASDERALLPPTLELAARSLRGTHDRVKKQLAEDAARCLAIDEARGSALLLTRTLSRFANPEPVRALLAATLRDGAPGRPLSTLAREAWATLEAMEDPGRWAALVPAFTAEKLGERRRAGLAEWLASSEDPEALAAVRAWAEGAEPSRKEGLDALLEAMERAVERGRARRAAEDKLAAERREAERARRAAKKGTR